ncbi:WD domain, G-beta repeat-containing protein [Eremomyces bilateralis CBS 781.70]|uniref:Coronin n=1 Tax=Eremomyces bilateralis CBS 781.70 TaxID=1392243 RepID=A0A6G1FR71_9PEZI|nr:WD domain, G-beta repeat-containing protein [Eremomyces bilateralis CBS 781.70]KAF1808273.1 WD domain, G-beta repeat-containing protein [Eremomyces bilateralis CBS 781.70]
MAPRFVRASKYRHVFGRSTKKEQCYDNLRISRNAWDSNIIKANPEYLAVNWEASGGGAFAVIPVNERGRLPEQLPLFRGHTAAVLDTDWNPFNDSLIASGADDGKVFIWQVPEDFTLLTDAEEPADVSPVARLSGHARKVGHVLFNPSAANVLASSSGDFSVKLWDIEAGTSKLQLKHGDIVQSMSWNPSGSLLVTTSRDKKLRIWDVRQEKPAHEVAGHSGAKNSRAVWMGELDRIATTGFSRMSDRQLGLWDARAPTEPIGGFQILDSISSICMPFWDDGTNCLYLAGKGDGNIRYYEYENDKFEYLSEYKSSDPQRGIAFVPKRGVNVHENEVMRAYKTVNDSHIEPVSFIVPRRAEVFQDDIYPPCVGLKPAMSAADWFAGNEGLPPMISLESVYEGEAPKEIPADYKPAAAKPATPPPAKVEPPKPVEEEKPKPVAAAGPPPSMKDNQASIASMASKFADNDNESDEEESEEEFEEVQKPIDRSAAVAARTEPAKPTPQAAPAQPAQPTVVEKPAPTPTPTAAPSSTAAPTGAGGPGEVLRTHLADIKSLIEAQSKQITALNGKVEGLELKIGQGGAGGSEREQELAEKVRRLEMELEEARG